MGKNEKQNDTVCIYVYLYALSPVADLLKTSFDQDICKMVLSL